MGVYQSDFASSKIEEEIVGIVEKLQQVGIRSVFVLFDTVDLPEKCFVWSRCQDLCVDDAFLDKYF